MAENKPSQPAKGGRVVHPVRGGRGEPSGMSSPASSTSAAGEQPAEEQPGGEQPGGNAEEQPGGALENLAEELCKQSLRWHANAAGEILNLDPATVADLMRRVADEIG